MNIRGLNSKSKELHDWITGNGHGALEGHSGGNHLRYKLSNGAVFMGALTPSSPSAVLNGKADVRRLLGIHSDGPNAAKYRHMKTDGYDGRAAKPGTSWAMPREVTDAQDELARLDADMPNLNPIRDRDRLLIMARRRVHLTDLLASNGITADRPRRTA